MGKALEFVWADDFIVAVNVQAFKAIAKMHADGNQSTGSPSKGPLAFGSIMTWGWTASKSSPCASEALEDIQREFRQAPAVRRANW